MVGDYGINSSGSSSARYTIFVNASTIINLIGNITNSQTSALTAITLFISTGTPTINITGNASGGSANTFATQTGNGIYCLTTTTINFTGNITTNSTPSIWFNTSGTLNLIGNVTGGTAQVATDAASIADMLRMVRSAEW